MGVRDIDLTVGADAHIRELGSLTYPAEGCGVLLGRFAGAGIHVLEATSGRNLITDRAHDRYLLDPADILHADRDARTRGFEVVGFWHSHPDHPAHPSDFDTDHAWLDYLYLIVNVTARGAGDINAFTLITDGGPFERLSMTVVPDGSEL